MYNGNNKIIIARGGHKMRNKKDLVQQAVSEIEDWIRSGKYANMELLPSEGDISIKLGVSRATARDAIRVLEVRGFLERIHGVGVKVNDRSMEVAISFLADMIDRNGVSFDELLEVRRLIEPKAAALAAINASEEELKIMEECVLVMESEDNSSNKYHESDYGFHEALARASGNRLLATIVSSYSPLLIHQIHEANEKNLLPESTQHFHRKIYEAILEKDSLVASETIMVHLDDSAKNVKK